MPFLFECPHCKTTSEVDDQFAGQEGPCFSCGKPIKMPEQATDHFAAAEQLLAKRRSIDFKRLAQVALMTIAILLLCGATGWLVLDVIIPRVGGDSPTARRKVSASNMQRIADAMLAYHDDYGSLPPAYLTDKKGQPAHSWRVLLLPYLGETELYSRYRFDEPYNGPNNSMLIGEMPEVYASPADEGALGFSDTSYMVVVGSRTMFPGAKTRKLSEATDGVDATILVTEVAESHVNWLSPSDLRTSRMRYEINGVPGVEISSGHAGGALVVTADGETHFLRNETRPEFVQALTTANGNESFRWEDLE